jgi:predicted small metal-binding protein
VHGGQRLFDVDPGTGREDEAHGAASREDVRADGGAQLREQHGERLGAVPGGRVAPDRLGQLVAADGARPVEHEVREQRAALTAREPLLDARPAELHHELPTELDIGVRRALQAPSNLSCNIRERPAANNRLHNHTMARQITCECGEIVRGETEQEVVELTFEHLRSDHPQLADKLGRDDIVALIEVVD